MHKFPILLFQLVVPYTKTLFKAEADSIQKNALGVLVTVIVILLCLVVELPISRFFPQVFGNIKSKGDSNK